MTKTMAKSSAPLVFVLLLSLLAVDQRATLAQSIDIRTVSDKQNAPSATGGQSRNIYSQKQLSAHRMMHFGKRPFAPQPPSFLISGSQLDADHQPALVSYSLQPLPEPVDQQANQYSNYVNGRLSDVLRNVLDYARLQQLRENARDQEVRLQQQVDLLQDQQLRPATIKLMKMINAGEQQADLNETSEFRNELGSEQEQQQQQQQTDDEKNESNISVAARSVPTMRGQLPTLTRAHLSSILLGRRLGDSTGTLIGLGNYIKKAEPQKMTFMHFG